MGDPIVGRDPSLGYPQGAPLRMTVVPSAERLHFKPVGITKGPGENAHEYTFVSRDDEQVLKNGEYVYYELYDHEESSPPHPMGAINREDTINRPPTGSAGDAAQSGVTSVRRVLGR